MFICRSVNECIFHVNFNSFQVHVWCGIGYRDRTDICIFTEIMDSVIYQQILQDNFVPFVTQVYPDGYRLYQVRTL